ncbi:tetratricopeptide repeat protein, partial [Spirulina sp. CS-785/01]
MAEPQNTFPDGFPKDPHAAVTASDTLSPTEKAEWYIWLQTATREQKAELVEILHSMWQERNAPVGGGKRSITQPNATREDYLRVWLEILQAEIDSKSDPEVVYPLLAQHQDKLDLTFAEIITQWFEAEIDPNNSRKNQDLARHLHNFAIDINQFPLGSRANNLEIAIASYHKALQIYTRAAFPEQWAKTQMNLGIAYQHRIRGERGENLETAIASYHKALQIYTRAAFPQDWAMTQMGLGNAYRNRIRGERG